MNSKPPTNAQCLANIFPENWPTIRWGKHKIRPFRLTLSAELDVKNIDRIDGSATIIPSRFGPSAKKMRKWTIKGKDSIILDYVDAYGMKGKLNCKIMDYHEEVLAPISLGERARESKGFVDSVEITFCAVADNISEERQ